ncbi:MAG: ABC transporter substrate-binding protein [Syntrophaceae bacterium]|nr:ABC transporter substrate-binding protein [Syntrophaceae bacterium]
MKTKGIFILVTGFILIILISNPLWAQEGRLKVGLLASMSGERNPDWGKKQAVGMKIAIEAVNKRGGVNGLPIEAVIYDTGGTGSQALSFYRKLALEDRVLVTIGPFFTEEFQALSEVTNEVRVPIIATASATPGLSDLDKRPYAFRMTVTSDKKEAPAAKAWILAHEIKKVVILRDQETIVWATLATRIWPVIMKGLDVEILNKEDPITFKVGEQNFGGLVKRARAYQPDGICISAYPEEAGHLIREIRRQGLKQPLLGASGIANPKVIEIAGASAEGLWSNALFYLEDPNPKVQKYVREFREICEKEYPGMNSDPEAYDVVVHDILFFLADIMKKEGIRGDPQRRQEERDKIRKGLANMGIWRGTAGMTAFDKKGDGIRTVHILKVKDGKWQPVY